MQGQVERELPLPPKEQIEALESLTRGGYFRHITSSNFPAIDAEVVSHGRFFAWRNFINDLLGMREGVQDEDLRARLDVVISSQIAQRDREYASGFGQTKETADIDLIAGFLKSRTSLDNLRMAALFVDFGFFEEINEGRLPELRALLPQDRVYLRLRAVSRRVAGLEEVRRTEPAGLRQPSDVSAGRLLESKLEALRRIQDELLGEYLDLSSDASEPDIKDLG